MHYAFLLPTLISFTAIAQPIPSFQFASSSTDLDADMRARLDVLAVELKASGQPVVIEGHTDALGAPALNVELAQARAERIATALVQRGVPRRQLTLRNLVTSKPVANNSTRDGRSQNRRVEIVRTAPEVPVALAAPVPVEPVAPTAAAAPSAEASGEVPTAVTAAAPSAEASAEVPTAVAADAPHAEPALFPAVAREPAAVTSARRSRGPGGKIVAASATAVAVGAGVTAAVLLADSASANSALRGNAAQLARADLLPATRVVHESRAAELANARDADLVGAGVVGAVALGAAITAVVLWINELTPVP